MQLDLTPDQLLDAIRGAHALIVRSATTVSADVIAAGVAWSWWAVPGIGLDNVDVDGRHPPRRDGGQRAAVQHDLGRPEHTMALLLAQARNVPQAHRALKEGRWERSQWTGVELAEKTLGIVGLGRIGKLVAERAAAFGMHLVGYDPFVSADRARRVGVELMELDQLLAESDFVTIHVAKTPETVGMINAERLAKAKPGIRIVNVARGGIVDENDLADAVRNGTVGGAALDVFDEEPTTSSPPVRPPRGRGDAAPGRQHTGGPGQGRHDYRRAGRPGAGGRVRPVRRQRVGHRGHRDRTPVPAPWPSSWALSSPVSAPRSRRSSTSSSRARSVGTTTRSPNSRSFAAC